MIQELQRVVQAIDLPGVTVTPTGLQMPEGASLEAYEGVDRALSLVSEGVALWRGDLYVQCEERYGEAAGQMIDPRDAGKALQRAWVARRVPPGVRELALGPPSETALGYSHLRVVAALEEEDQAHWLQRARDNNWSVRDLTDNIRGESAPKPDPPDIPLALRMAQSRVGQEWRTQDQLNLGIHLGAINEG